jgi:hypothetical protein
MTDAFISSWCSSVNWTGSSRLYDLGDQIGEIIPLARIEEAPTLLSAFAQLAAITLLRPDEGVFSAKKCDRQIMLSALELDRGTQRRNGDVEMLSP